MPRCDDHVDAGDPGARRRATSIGPKMSLNDSTPRRRACSSATSTTVRRVGVARAACRPTSTLPPIGEQRRGRRVGDVGVGDARRQLVVAEVARRPGTLEPGFGADSRPGAICPNTSATSARSSTTTSTPRGLRSTLVIGVDLNDRTTTGPDVSAPSTSPIPSSPAPSTPSSPTRRRWRASAACPPLPAGRAATKPVADAVGDAGPHRGRRRVLLGRRHGRVGRREHGGRRVGVASSAAPAAATDVAVGVGDVRRQVDRDGAERRRAARRAGRASSDLDVVERQPERRLDTSSGSESVPNRATVSVERQPLAADPAARVGADRRRHDDAATPGVGSGPHGDHRQRRRGRRCRRRRRSAPVGVSGKRQLRPAARLRRHRPSEL